MSMRSYAKLPDLLARSTSAVGLMISLGEEFISRGITEMDAHILPKVRVALGGVNPRIPPNYALMIWFTMEVGIAVITLTLHPQPSPGHKCSHLVYEYDSYSINVNTYSHITYECLASCGLMKGQWYIICIWCLRLPGTFLN